MNTECPEKQFDKRVSYGNLLTVVVISAYPSAHLAIHEMNGMLSHQIRGIAQPGSASALGAEGRGFKSLCPDQVSLNYQVDLYVIMSNMWLPYANVVLNTAPVAQLDRASAF